MNRKGPWEGTDCLPLRAHFHRERAVWVRGSYNPLFTPCKEIQDSLGFCILRRGFRIPTTGFQSFSVERGFWIPILSGITDSLHCIPDSKARDSGFQEQTFPRFGNPDSHTWGDVMERLHHGMHALECCHVACLKRDSMYSYCMCSCSRTT